MPEPQSRLQVALADRYRFEREQGQGGMATVYLAEDLEGRLAALADDKVGTLQAYRNYLRMRVDPEPSRVTQLDSVRAELSAVGDLEGRR